MAVSVAKLYGRALAAAGLRFRSNHVEDTYDSYRVMNDFNWLDYFWGWLHLPLYLILVVNQLRKYGLWGEGTKLALAHGPSVFLHWCLMTWVPQYEGSRWAAWRPVCAVALRFLFCPLAVLVSFPSWFMEPVVGFSTMMRFFLTSSSVLISTCGACFMPLSLKTHIPLQGVSLLILLQFHVPENCAVAIRTPEGRQYFVWLWKLLTKASCGMLSLLYRAPVELGSEPGPAMACRHISAWWLLFVSFVFPTWGLWIWEHRSRSRFLKLRPQNVSRENRVHWEAKNRGLGEWYVAPLLLFLAVSWQALVKIYGVDT